MSTEVAAVVGLNTGIFSKIEIVIKRKETLLSLVKYNKNVICQ